MTVHLDSWPGPQSVDALPFMFRSVISMLARDLGLLPGMVFLPGCSVPGGAACWGVLGNWLSAVLWGGERGDPHPIPLVASSKGAVVVNWPPTLL